MNKKLMKTFTTATAVVCLFRGSIMVDAKLNDVNHFKSKNVHIEQVDDKNINIVNDNGTFLFEAKKKNNCKYVNVVSLNIRRSQTTKYKPVKTVKIGTKLKVIGKSKETGWSIIELDECENGQSIGFVRSEYLSKENPVIDLGEFRLTWYCSCYECNEGYDGTSTGHDLIENYTIAVDPNVIPYGTHVYIEGYGDYVADDCGGAIKNNSIDIFTDHHGLTESLGVDYKNVYIIKDK